MQVWVKFLEGHPHPHLVVGWTRNVSRWRNAAFLQMITTLRPSGKFSFKRDFDQDRAQYLVLIGFEKEGDATKLGQFLGAENIDRYAGYISQRAFELGPEVMKKLSAATHCEVLPFPEGRLSGRDACSGYGRSAQSSSLVSETLTARERDILAMISQGLSNKRITRAREISPETVKSHVKHIFLKLAVSTRAHAVSQAGSLGLLEAAPASRGSPS